MGRGRSPWSCPKRDPPPTQRQLEAARKQAVEDPIGETLTVGEVTKLRTNIIGGANRRLAEWQFVHIAFERIPIPTQKAYVVEIARGTASVCVYHHANVATFFRKHPNLRYPPDPPRPRRS